MKWPKSLKVNRILKLSTSLRKQVMQFARKQDAARGLNPRRSRTANLCMSLTAAPDSKRWRVTRRRMSRTRYIILTFIGNRRCSFLPPTSFFRILNLTKTEFLSFKKVEIEQTRSKIDFCEWGKVVKV
jgi:hypothetical protein